MTRHGTAFWGWMVFGSWLVPSLATAQSAANGSPSLPSRERLQYAAPEGCPSESEFVAAVRTRGQSFEAAGSTVSQSRFEVAIEKDTSGFHASLTVVNESSSSNPREVRAPSCPEVVDALAVVTAIALDAPALSVLPNAGAPKNDGSQPAGVQPEPRVRASSVVSRKISTVEAGTVRIDGDIAITAAGAAVIGLVPSHVMPRLDIGFARANFVTLPNGDTSLVGAVVRIRASLLLDQTVRRRDQQARIGGQELGIGVCFSPLYDTRGWVLLACNELAAGFMGYRTTDATRVWSGTKTQGYGAIGLGVEASYDFGAHLQVGLRFGGQLLTDRVRVQRSDGAEMFHSSPVLGAAALSLGAHF